NPARVGERDVAFDREQLPSTVTSQVDDRPAGDDSLQITHSTVEPESAARDHGVAVGIEGRALDERLPQRDIVLGECSARERARGVREPGLYSGDRVSDAGRARRDCAGEERSEEHTSEFQSRRDLVCRLLLEKKKKK